MELVPWVLHSRPMRNPEDLFQALKKSPFRGRFHLTPKGRKLTPEEQTYILQIITHWLTNQGVTQSHSPTLFS